MNVLIIGGSGYLGGRIAHHLSDAGKRVYQGVRSSFIEPRSKSCNRFLPIDLFSEDSLIKSFEGFDVIIHAAGPNSQECVKNPEKARAFSSICTKNICRAAVKASIKKLIFLSTVHVYSSPLIGSINENQPLLNDHPYAISNALGEKAILELIGTSTKPVVLRLTNCFGRPIQPKAKCWMLFVNDICKAAINEHSIEIKDNPNLKRNFMPISYLNKVIECFLEKKNNYSIYNVGWEESLSLKMMANRVQEECYKILNFRPKLRYLSAQTPSNQLVINIDRLISEFDGEPKYFDEELQKLLIYCNEKK